MDIENRDDLIPSSCKRCEVEVVAATHNGVPGFWVQHGTESRLVTSGAEAQLTLAALHGKHEDNAVETSAGESTVTFEDDTQGVPA